MGRKRLLIGGSRGEDEFEKFKLRFPQFENLYTENVMQLWGDVVFSMRFQRLTEGRNKDAETAWIEHTPIYKDQYLQDDFTPLAFSSLRVSRWQRQRIPKIQNVIIPSNEHISDFDDFLKIDTIRIKKCLKHGKH